MWRLHRYYLRELAVNAAITFVVLFAVVLVSGVYRGIQRSQGGGPLDALLITVFFALDSFQHLLTISFLMATVMTFTRAAQDRELVAIRAAGISPRTPMAAAVLAGLVLTVLGSFAVHYLVPEVHFRKYRVVADIVRSAFLSMNLGSDRIRLPGSDYVMTFRERDGEQYRHCTIYMPEPRPPLRSPILFVERVAIPPIEEGAEAITIVLDGITDPLGGSTPVRETRLSVPIGDVATRDRREDRDDDLRSDQLLAEVMREVHRNPHDAIYTLVRRCCFSVMPALLAPIGYCLAEWARERGRVVALVAALVPLALFYFGEVLGQRLLLSTSNPAYGCLPVVLLLAFGLPLCWRQLRR